MALFLYRIPDMARHAHVPDAKDFAVLAAVESFPRAILSSVFPIMMYRALGDAGSVSEAYLGVGILSFTLTMFMPALNRLVPRRWLYSIGVVLLGGGGAIGAWSLHFDVLPGVFVPVALASTMFGTVTIAVCFNAYVMDYVERHSLGRAETLRLVYSAACWSLCPFLGVWLLQQWAPLPFVIAAVTSVGLMVMFWWKRLGNGKAIVRAKRPAANPLAFLPRFIEQPRLIAGWIFAVTRSVAWWVYYVYMPILVIEAGYDETVSGLALSVTNALLLLTPFMLKWVQRRSVRRGVVTGFLGTAIFYAAATPMIDISWLALLSLFAGTFFMILLDVCAGLPFLMAVKPSERTEMSAVYSTFRDVSGVVTPALAWVVLLVAPFSAIFAVTGAVMVGSAAIATRLHPRLGASRPASA